MDAKVVLVVFLMTATMPCAKVQAFTCRKVGRFADKSDPECRRFFVCRVGVLGDRERYEYICPPGLPYFNTKTKFCTNTVPKSCYGRIGFTPPEDREHTRAAEPTRAAEFTRAVERSSNPINRFKSFIRNWINK